MDTGASARTVVSEMTEGTPRKAPRALLTSFPERYSLPARPANATASVLDAYRQTNFLLPEEFALFERVLNLQLRLVATNAKAKGVKAAALFSLWSRVVANLADACQSACCGSYVSCPPLLRAALDCIAVEKSLVAGGFAEYEEWFAEGIAQERSRAATAIDIGRFRSASVLIDDERLGPLFRLLSDLSMPHLGSSLFFASPEVSPQKAPLAFADGAFHLGWAELISGWLILLATVQLETSASSGVLTLPRALAMDCEAIQRDATPVLESKRRCYVEPDGDRFLFYNFRRTATGQPKRVILG